MFHTHFVHQTCPAHFSTHTTWIGLKFCMKEVPLNTNVWYKFENEIFRFFLDIWRLEEMRSMSHTCAVIPTSCVTVSSIWHPHWLCRARFRESDLFVSSGSRIWSPLQLRTTCDASAVIRTSYYMLIACACGRLDDKESVHTNLTHVYLGIFLSILDSVQ